MPGEGAWGVRVEIERHADGTHAYRWESPLKAEEDLGKLFRPEHAIDEEKTAERVEKLQEAVGDALPVVADRSPIAGHINQLLGKFRGIEQTMLDMVERPEWLHRLVGFLQKGILAAHEAAERAGHWRLLNHHNQSIPYGREREDPRSDGPPGSRGIAGMREGGAVKYGVAERRDAFGA